MSKSADAFRTISEVADWLGIPAHVLRFWESKFTQVKPVKRAGGRRYYRPADMQLLGGIRKLLHDEGMTIKGVQKIMREQGVRHVAAMSPPLDDDLEDAIAGIALDVPETEEPRGTVLSFDRAKGDTQPDARANDANEADPQEPAAVGPDADDSPPTAAMQGGETAGDDAAPDPIAEAGTAGNPASRLDDSQTSLPFDDVLADTPHAAPTDPAAETSADAPNQPAASNAALSRPEPDAEPEASDGTESDDTEAARDSAPVQETSARPDDANHGGAPLQAAAEIDPGAPTDATSRPGGGDRPEAAAVPAPQSSRVAKIDVPEDPGDDIPADASMIARMVSLDRAQLDAQRPALSDLAGRMADLRARMSRRNG